MVFEVFLRRLVACGVALGFATAAVPAAAQTAVPPEAPPSATDSDGQTVTEDTSYSATVALIYGIGYSGTFAGYYMTRGSRPYGVRIAGAIILPSGVITTLFGPMLVHFDKGASLGTGLASVGGQVGAIVAGAAAGYGIAAAADTEDPGTAMLIGGLSAHIGWAVFDTLVLARDEQVVDRTIPAPSYALSLAPEAGGGVRAGALFRF